MENTWAGRVPASSLYSALLLCLISTPPIPGILHHFPPFHQPCLPEYSCILLYILFIYVYLYVFHVYYMVLNSVGCIPSQDLPGAFPLEDDSCPFPNQRLHDISLPAPALHSCHPSPFLHYVPLHFRKHQNYSPWLSKENFKAFGNCPVPLDRKSVV